jgi:uncharacterized protein YndB with AHSA1/START domain
MKAETNLTTPSDCEIEITRDFDAPRKLVWQAMTTPDTLKRWLLGPPGWSMAVCEEDPRVGGAFRYVWRGSEGAHMAMRGVYREVIAGERAVRTEEFELKGEPVGEKQSTLVLAERGDRTAVTLTMRFPSKEARDEALRFGAKPNYDQLDGVLASMTSKPA